MINVFIDTNIFISAALFPNGKASDALKKAFMPPYNVITSDYVIHELHEKISEKFPNKTAALDTFLSAIYENMVVVTTSQNVSYYEHAIRDIKDRPILRAALESHSEYLLTGDKDFLESSINNPRIIGVNDFILLP